MKFSDAPESFFVYLVVYFSIWNTAPEYETVRINNTLGDKLNNQGKWYVESSWSKYTEWLILKNEQK